jgi:DnaJ-class molecular chaperone
MSNTSHNRSRRPTHYDVLQLPRNADWSRLSKDEVKAAYRRALLLHHPDKAPPAATLKDPGSSRPYQAPTYSIDDIAIAYEVLVDPERRVAYNKTLNQGDVAGPREGDDGEQGTHPGVEVLDLEDLSFDEGKSIWSKSCRCGYEQGYILTESDLEKESQNGEIYIGCRGCSLFIKVLFALEET